MTNASGPDGITARLLKDAAPVITTPITYLVNLTILTGLIGGFHASSGNTNNNGEIKKCWWTNKAS